MDDDQLSKVFAALADPVRRGIVARLHLGAATVNEIAAPYEISLQAISKHLGVLEAAGLITRDRDGRRRWCRLDRSTLDASVAWIDRYRSETEERYARLDEVLAAGRSRPTRRNRS